MDSVFSDSMLTPELLELLANLALSTGAQLSPELYTEQNSEVKSADESNFVLSPTSEGSSSTDMSHGRTNLSQRSRSAQSSSHACPPAYVLPSGMNGIRSMGSPTTFMLKNLPNNLTREELFSFLQQNLPAGVINFLYMPIDYKNGLNFGYAFVNLIHEQYVESFYKHVGGKRVPGNMSAVTGSQRPVDIVPARVQGFTANINRLIASPVLFTVEEQSLPLIFYNNVQVSFRDLMNLNRASILYQTKPSVEELIQALISDEQYQYI